MGFMGAAAANKGKWTLIADVIYLNVSEDNNGSLSIPVGSGIAISDKANVKLKGWIPTFSVQYNLIDTDKADAVLGYRYMDWTFDNNAVFDDLNLSRPFAGVKFIF